VASLKYQLLAVFACCTLIAVAYLPPRERPSRWSAPRRVHVDSIWVDREDNHEVWEAATQLQRLSSRFWTSRDYLSFLERRDSVVASLPVALTSRAGLHVVAASDVPTQAVDRVRSFAVRLTADLPAGSHGTPVALALVLDTTSASWTRMVHSVPTKEANICLTTALLGSLSLQELERPSVRAEQILRTSADRLLGMCAYFGRFGEPGRHVGHWLRQSRYATAVSAEWLVRPSERATESVRGDRGFTRYSWNISLDRMQCVAGEIETCDSIATREDPWLYTLVGPHTPTDVVVGYLGWQYNWHALGGNVVSYLSDLVITMGEDRFQRFWSSELQLEEAFAQAFGVTIAEWTMQWSRDQIGIPRTGASAPADVTMISLLLAVVFVSGGVAFSVRRQVG